MGCGPCPVRETETEACEYVAELVFKLDDDCGENIRKCAPDNESLGVPHQKNNSDLADVEDFIEPHLWTGTVGLWCCYAAEETLVKALKDSTALREQMQIITPVGHHNDARVKHYDTRIAHITTSVEHSLRLMHIDHIDVLLIHRSDPLMDQNETGRAPDALVAWGKVCSIGVFNFRPYDVNFLQSAMQQRLVTNQIEISLVTHHALTNGDLAYHQQHGIPLMAWSPLAGGALFGNSHPSPASGTTRHGKKNTIPISVVLSLLGC